MMARPTSPHATAMPIFAAVDSRDDCLGCEVFGGVDVPSGGDVVDSSSVFGGVEEGDELSRRDVVDSRNVVGVEDGDVLPSEDVVDSGNVVGAVEYRDEIDFEELDCDDEIACPTTAAILIPLPSAQQFLFPPPQHQEPSLHSVTATFCAAALPSTPAS